jgi:hypothetical protein
MKTTFKTILAALVLSITVASCASTKGTAYQGHLKNKKNHCLHSDFGCGWANKGKR